MSVEARWRRMLAQIMRRASPSHCSVLSASLQFAEMRESIYQRLAEAGRHLIIARNNIIGARLFHAESLHYLLTSTQLEAAEASPSACMTLSALS